MHKILLAGCNGQIGFELQRSLAALGEVTAFDRSRCDLADPESLRAAVR
jgi:dTDP-4-dehydrorhamnose reductase